MDVTQNSERSRKIDSKGESWLRQVFLSTVVIAALLSTAYYFGWAEPLGIAIILSTLIVISVLLSIAHWRGWVVLPRIGLMIFFGSVVILSVAYWNGWVEYLDAVVILSTFVVISVLLSVAYWNGWVEYLDAVVILSTFVVISVLLSVAHDELPNIFGIILSTTMTSGVVFTWSQLGIANIVLSAAISAVVAIRVRASFVARLTDIDCLSNSNPVVRLRGVKALYQRAKNTQDPSAKEEVWSLFNRHALRSTQDTNYRKSFLLEPSVDIQETINIRARREEYRRSETFLNIGLEARINWQGTWLRGATLAGAQLQGADLTGAQLQGTDLREAQLLKTNLRKAQLQEADLASAQLQGANLIRAQLQRANLWKTQLQEAKLKEAQLQGADLAGAWLRGADLSKARLQGADLTGARLQGANLKGARLRRTKLVKTQFQGADLRRAQLQEADLDKAKLQGVNLTKAHLRKATLRETQLQGAVLEGAQLQEANLWEAQLQGANLVRAQLQGANLVRAQLQGANLHQADLRGAILTEAQLQGAYDNRDDSVLFEERLKDRMEKDAELDNLILKEELSAQDVALGSYSKEKADRWIKEFEKAVGQIEDAGE